VRDKIQVVWCASFTGTKFGGSGMENDKQGASHAYSLKGVLEGHMKDIKDKNSQSVQ
jgi:hypothetical protein